MNKARSSFKTLVAMIAISGSLIPALGGVASAQLESPTSVSKAPPKKPKETPSFPILAGACRSSRRLHGPGGNGLDITIPGSDKGVRAPCDGQLSQRTDPGGYGYYAVVACKSGPQKGCEVLLGHMQERGRKRSGPVVKGDVVGLVGSTGYSTGPHMHVEVKCNGRGFTHKLATSYEKNFCGIMPNIPKKPRTPPDQRPPYGGLK